MSPELPANGRPEGDLAALADRDASARYDARSFGLRLVYNFLCMVRVADTATGTLDSSATLGKTSFRT
jgi:hypothetical protein